MNRQIKRFKDKRQRGRGRDIDRAEQMETAAIEMEAVAAEEETLSGKIVRTKRFPIGPMSDEEAIEQMELLGHDFYVFYNVDDNRVNVVYRRADGDYGLLQPELA